MEDALTVGNFRVTSGSLVERFERNIELGDGGCWNWTRATNGVGYGRMWDGSKLILVHRWSYEYHVGPIPAGLQLDHLCRNRRCANPEHLEPVTPRVNALRGIAGEVHRQRAAARRALQATP